MSKWKAGLAAAALISLAAAFPAFATETIDFVTLDIYMGITPGESGNNMGVGLSQDLSFICLNRFYIQTKHPYGGHCLKYNPRSRTH